MAASRPLSLLNDSAPTASFADVTRRTLRRFKNRAVDVIRRRLETKKNDALPTTVNRKTDIPSRHRWPFYFNVCVVGATAFDLFVPSSLHLLLPVDQGIHHFVEDNIQGLVDPFLLDPILSDFGIALWILTWLAVDVLESSNVGSFAGTALNERNLKLGGAVVATEGAVGLMKLVFRRHRPKAYPISYSFPSGHTSAAFVLGGVVLFLKLRPYLLKRDAIPAAWRGASDTVLTVAWLTVGVITATSRMACDAHWFSDTLAGAAAGSAAFSVIRVAIGRDDVTSVC